MPVSFSKAFRNAHRVSPSQVDTFMLCKCKWGLEKLDGIPRPPTEKAQFGLDCHDVLEKWQRDGTAIDLSTPIGRVVSPGLKFLPRPGTHRTEYDFSFDTGNVVFHGRIDLRGPAAERVQTVWDHKTTGSFQWLKKPERLRRDSQAIIYGKAALVEAYQEGLVWYRNLDCIELNWVYYLADPDKPRSRKVQLVVVLNDKTDAPSCPSGVRPEHFGVMTLGELEARFAEIEQIGIEMLTYHQEKRRGLDLPRNPRACGAYGGCPYQDQQCVLTLSERIRAMAANEQVTNVSLEDKIRRNMEAAGQSTTPPATAGATAPAAAPIPPEPQEQPAEKPVEKPAEKPAGPPPPPRALAAAQQTATAATTATAPAEAADQAPQVNPPEKDKGVDPDEPAQVPVEGAGQVSRAEVLLAVTKSLIETRVYSIDDNRYEAKVVGTAMRVTREVFKALAGK